MKTVAELRARADRRLFAADYADALYDYSLLVAVQPLHLDVRLRVADCLLALGEVQKAAVVYTALARHAAHAGYPLRALVAVKILATLEPQLEALMDGIAKLYGMGSDRLGRGVRVSPGDPRQPLPEKIQLECPWPLKALVAGAEKVAADVASIGVPYPETLPPLLLFSQLPAEAFAGVLHALRLVRAKPGEVIIREGEHGRSFFVVARGAVRVTRRGTQSDTVHLATLHDGAIFGEMALVSDLPRAASVSAVTDCDLLEFDRQALASATRDADTVARALDRFRRERLLNNLLASASLFKPLTRQQRLDLARRFTSYDFQAGDVIIGEGQPGRGLFMLLSGQVDISKVDGHEKVLLATLQPGEVFGEISLIHDQSTTATVTAASAGSVLFLNREYFQKLVTAVPEIRSYVEGLSEERLMDTRILLSGEAAPPGPVGRPALDATDSPTDADEDERILI